MTDKTAQNNTENMMNDPAALPKTRETTPDSGAQSKALPQADALKARFKAGSIPLETDFANLIDLANMGRQAVGGAEGQTGPAKGFTLSPMGRLELKPNAAKGVSVDQDGVAIKVGKGMRINTTGMIEPDINSHSFGTVEEGTDFSPVKVNSSTNGLVVDLYQGLINTASGLAVNVKDGLQQNSTGVAVKAGNGVAVNSSGVNLKLAKGANTNGGEGHGTDGTTSGSGGGLNLTSNGLSVDAGDGIQINTRGVSLKLANNSGLSADEANGLSIVPQQTLQRGMIMMFSGSGIPSGWALCDGKNGTPNLIDRFILGGNSGDVGKTGGQSITGSGYYKTYTVYTNAVSAGQINVNIFGTVLAARHIPPHNHQVKYSWNNDGGGYTVTSVINANIEHIQRRALVDDYGVGAEAHTHSGTASQGTHSHTINTLPAYYILAFIMKL